jgi:hypothetical protein
MHLRERLASYLRLFAKRTDVHVSRCEWGAPAAVPELPPGEIADFLGAATLHFTWSFEAGEPPQGSGGHLFLAADHERKWEGSDGRWLERASSSLLIDHMVDEGLGLLVVDDGDAIAQAKPAFFDANDDRLIRFASLEAYLTQGARRAFAWYWQNDDNAQWSELLERLRGASLEAGAGEDALVDRLRAQGASDAEARALCAWLGDDARVLVPRSG